MRRSESIEKLTEALASAQALIEGAAKDKENPHFRSRYADLASIWDACRVPLSSHGLAVIQTTEPGESGGIVLETTLAHTSGQWVTGAIPVNCDTKNPQAIGSALTYARRYGLAAMVGVCPDDDDGEAALPQRDQRNSRPAGRDQRPQRDQRPPQAEPRRQPDRPEPPAPQATGEANTKEAKRFEEEVKVFCTRMNAGWLDKHTTADGMRPGWVKDLVSTFQIVGHTLKAHGAQTGGTYGERMKAATTLWLANPVGVAKEWRAYVKGLADGLEQEHAGTDAELVGATVSREPGSDDE